MCCFQAGNNELISVISPVSIGTTKVKNTEKKPLPRLFAMLVVNIDTAKFLILKKLVYAKYIFLYKTKTNSKVFTIGKAEFVVHLKPGIAFYRQSLIKFLTYTPIQPFKLRMWIILTKKQQLVTHCVLKNESKTMLFKDFILEELFFFNLLELKCCIG